MITASQNLNADQLKAVEHPGGPLLVLAGPGTGKTGVLVARISHLVANQGVRPERILALTFSRRAADEMRARVTGGLPEAEKVEVRTFHSFALSMVRRHAGSLGLRSAPEIVPTNEQWALVSDILGEEDPASWGLPPGAFYRPATVREVYDLMLRAQEYLLGPKRLRDLGERTGRPYLVRAGAVLERYGDRLKRAAKADYEGVVQYALRLLRPGGRTAAEISGLYDHVLVDEFQDTNGSQMELLHRLMPGERPNVFCVGDDAQSIYGFRGARIENAPNFAEIFPGTREIHLRTNYRSAAHIVSLAEQAIGGDESRPARDPQAVASIANLGTVLHKVAASPREEGEWIADRIVELTQGQGVPREEIAILRRSLLDAAPLVDALASRGIRVDMAVSPGGSSARHLATLLAATSENADDPNPTPAAHALVSPLCGVSPEAVRALRAAAEAGGRSVFDLLRSGDSVAGVPEQELEKARTVVRTVDAAARQNSFAEKVDVLWKGLPATRGLFERHTEEQEAALALTDALSFVRSAHAYARMSHRPTVEGFLRAGKMLHEDSDTWAPSAPPAEGAVRLLTVHASKGLEFEAVFVSGLVDERFPIRPRGVRFVAPGLSAKLFPEERTPASALATAEALPPPLEIYPEPDAAEAYDEMDAAALKASLARGTREEEGRLFYVACTRARDTLTLSRAHYYRDNVRPKQPGAFWQLLLEAPQECAIHFAPEPEVPETNPNIEETGGPEESQPDPWPIAATAQGDDARIAAALGVEGWEDELSDLRRDVENIPARPRPRHVLPPPQTHSPSSLMDLETCARRYYYTYVFPVPFGSERMEESQEYGSAVHAWIEDGMQGDPPKPERATGNGTVRAPAGDFATSEYALKAYSYPLHEGADLPEQGPARMVEVSFAIEIGGSELRGRIDAVFLDEDGTVHLIDWKTGRPHESYKQRLQLPIYALAANRLWGVEPERMRLAYIFVPGAERVEVEVREGFLGSAEQRVIGAIETILSGAYDPSPSHHACSYCPVIGVGIEGCPTEVPET